MNSKDINKIADEFSSIYDDVMKAGVFPYRLNHKLHKSNSESQDDFDFLVSELMKWERTFSKSEKKMKEVLRNV